MIWRIALVAGLALAPAARPVSLASQPVLERPPIFGIARIVFRVTTIEPARQFYGHVLGLLPEGGTGGGCVRYRVNDRQEIAIEPGLPADEDERLSYLAFETASLDTLGTYLRAHGVAPELHAPTTACAVARALWVKDPDGHLLAFFESHRPSESDATTDARAVSTRILHGGLTIADAAAADRFYKDVLGFSEIWRGGRTDDVTSWINMKVPNGTDYLEYMLVTGPVNRQQRGTLHHVALLVPDIQTALETVRKRTPEPDRDKIASPQVGRNRRWQLNLFDPDGTRTELMEPHPMR